MPSGSESIRAGPLVQALVVFFVKVRDQKYVRRLWKPSPGIMSASNLCIKVKPYDNMAEAHTMQFIAQQTSIPVPKVICAFTHKGKTYIVMSKIDGQMIGRGWNNRPEKSKRRILEQLQAMVAELRGIPPPDGTGVGNVNGGPFCDCRLPSKLHWGPYTSVRDFHEALANGANMDLEYENLPEGMPELFRFYRQSSNVLVFSHGDLSSLNILARGDELVGIIDWETAGWFPPYWEYTCAKYANPQNAFWADEVDHFLPAMPYELKMENTRRQYFGAF
ncbi:hypothetical protein JX265_011363 [Neoarthrinium moseri]|uniref:Aminoglycoside phosphotransferase domain-containing protein n=1 Tax=Neoarthrinium moseri TaxID=1658444 RepID=A0A9P9WCR4_9PEZI|nr:hypothetical protein JX265_011363 [Neoarthrinium moseri]